MKVFRLNIKQIIYLSLKISGGFFTLLTVLLTFFSWTQLKIDTIWVKLIILIGIIIISFIISSLLYVFVLRTKQIWTKGKNKVSAMYGDLMKIAFSKKNTRRIVLIPVNDTFDTIVEIASETITKPLVSPNTIHGMWVNKFCKTTECSPNKLSERIQDNLNNNGYTYSREYTKEDKPRGNRKSYKTGTTAIIDGPNGVEFYLLVISSFDTNNNSQSSRTIIRDSFERFLEFYDKKGQAVTLYVPLMGTGNSRAGLTHEQSLNILKSCVLTSESKINGEINIVVYNGDKDKVSIFK